LKPFFSSWLSILSLLFFFNIVSKGSLDGCEAVTVVTGERGKERFLIVTAVTAVTDSP
jgi:hypothetical protein